jgi:phage-related minor tail protein
VLCRRLGSIAVVLAMSVAPAGCGGGDAGNPERWANDVCTSLGAWIDDVDGALQSLGEQGLELDAEDVREAADEIQDATDELASDLRELGLPETASAQRAEDELEILRAELQTQLETIRRAAETSRDPLEFAATVVTALAAASNQLERTFENLQELDPGGELEEGFRDAEACDDLRDRIEEID